MDEMQIENNAQIEGSDGTAGSGVVGGSEKRTEEKAGNCYW